MNPGIFRHFAGQAEACDRMGSPFTAALCRLLPAALDEGTLTGKTILNWPGDLRADALALRICAGLHALVLDNADPDLSACYPPSHDPARLKIALQAAIAAHDKRLAAGLSSAPQTNETGRAAVLFPAIALIARETGRPLGLREIGSSAGLNLLMDRFCYRYDGTIAGDTSSTVVLEPEVRRERPAISGTVSIASRKGCDIAPVDVTRPADRLRLRSHIWPDQPERLKRLDAAIGIVAENPVDLTMADAADFVENILDRPVRGETLVIFHSIMWQYLPVETKRRIESALQQSGRSATASSPLAWLRMEPLASVDPFAVLTLTIWPSGKTRRLANCDYHGRWIEWLA